MSNSERVKELCKKLMELANRGVGGEKINAEQKLEQLLKKHGLTIEDIESEKRTTRTFMMSKSDYRLFVQVAATVLGRDYEVYQKTDNARRRNKIYYIDTTTSEFIEIQSKFEFYIKEYNKELDIFYRAFITANNLFPKNGTPKDVSELTEEQRNLYNKAQRLAQAIDAAKYRKRLEKKQ